MAHTYLDLVNKVLVNLRETAGQSQVNATQYTTLIGEFVNQAKETVEDHWRWSALTTELQFVTNVQQVYYPLDSAATGPSVTSNTGRYPDERSYVLKDDRDYDQAFDITLASSLVIYQMTAVARERSAGDIYLAGARTPSTPYLFSYTWEYSNVTNGMRPVFYMVNPPIANRTIAVRMFIPQPEMIPGANEATVILAPWRPIVSLATALAMQERGEELGQSADLYMARYQAELLRAEEKDRLTSHAYDQLQVDYREGGGWSIT